MFIPDSQFSKPIGVNFLKTLENTGAINYVSRKGFSSTMSAGYNQFQFFIIHEILQKRGSSSDKSKHVKIISRNFWPLTGLEIKKKKSSFSFKYGTGVVAKLNILTHLANLLNKACIDHKRSARYFYIFMTIIAKQTL